MKPCRNLLAIFCAIWEDLQKSYKIISEVFLEIISKNLLGSFLANFLMVLCTDIIYF